MTPTPEQIAAWALEAGVDSMPSDQNYRQPYYSATPEELQHFAALACAWQAEQDVAICKARDTGDMTREDMEARRCAEAIRASVKGNTCQN